VKKLEELSTPGDDVPAAHLTDVMDEAIETVAASDSGYSGIVLIVDELGKFLEYAATHPEDGDVFILQSMAESASRSEKPFLLVTILHQAIDRYTAHISSSRRQEWAKVQGRFEDVAFEEPTEQVVRLMAQAIDYGGSDASRRGLEKQGLELAGEAFSLGARIGGLEKREFVDLLSACMPLHPTVAMVFGPLFRDSPKMSAHCSRFSLPANDSVFKSFSAPIRATERRERSTGSTCSTTSKSGSVGLLGRPRSPSAARRPAALLSHGHAQIF
jgi:hypothetical protein